ncbi:MAG: tRNA preQ1(34) S-adenosylmethionine ribosyltransferase-isomerase QueA [Gammaproteobacteria bacterium]|nr:tRNA preQ1(34) S-adenosylmethionine ribosyltransferase-isomerase QueA [Gammaproteobacteria bacterium]MDH3767602.1 tRNA preQ1(34) S-adenosylmethionine ribosyltransferase-isomerase QueA [Gammaproteobacteria bacterium]
MRRADFFYELPQDLIAQRPPPNRSDARLLCLDGDTGALADRTFTDLPELLQPGDLLVFNRSRVIPARVFGRKISGGRVELLIERIVDTHRVTAQIRASKTPGPETLLKLDGGVQATLLGRDYDHWTLEFDTPVSAYLEKHGHVPLPPYITRDDEAVDQDRYQTVYADRPGAIAAPTAGLHFDDMMLKLLTKRDIELAFVTLHVGAGTFQPVRNDDLSLHKMHAERMIVEQGTVDAIAATHDRGGRVVAVGTTTVRTLESAADGTGKVEASDIDTRLFIQPGFRFRVVDAMITNFHLPESTLLMLVSAFAGHTAIMRAYAHAVDECYRFFSYGDAMFITCNKEAHAI